MCRARIGLSYMQRWIFHDFSSKNSKFTLQALLDIIPGKNGFNTRSHSEVEHFYFRTDTFKCVRFSNVFNE